jgi:phage gp16-like protein
MRHPAVLDPPGARKADLAAIHIAKAELGWDDDFYRSIMQAKCGVTSSALLDYAGRKRFLAHLRACGWQGGTRGAASAGDRNSGRSRAPLTPSQRKMWALWQQLADAGLVDSRRMPALVAFAARQTGVERLEWLKPAQEDLVIESLKAWLRRKAAP